MTSGSLQLIVREDAVPVSNFNSQCEGEGVPQCWGLANCDEGLIVTDWKNKNVKVFDKDNFRLKLTLEQDRIKLREPFDVAHSYNADTFVTDNDIKGVFRYDALGRLTKVYLDLYEREGYIACHNDQLIVSDTLGERVVITDFDCNIHHKLDGHILGLDKFRPRHVCVDSSGRLVVCQWKPGRVHVIDYTRSTVVFTLKDQLSDCPEGVCADSHGHILVADDDRVILYDNPDDNSRAQVIVPRGDVVRPTGVCIPAAGQVSVVEWGTGVVKTFQYLKE